MLDANAETTLNTLPNYLRDDKQENSFRHIQDKLADWGISFPNGASGVMKAIGDNLSEAELAEGLDILASELVDAGKVISNMLTSHHEMKIRAEISLDPNLLVDGQVT